MPHSVHLLILALFSLVSAIFSHPQCLDFRAPFEPTAPLGFCSEYANYSCCESSNDDKLRNEYAYIQRKSSPRLWGRCQGFVKQLLCQRCSPFAAHIYDAETSGKPRGFPGLCSSYCHEFYDQCRTFVWFLDPGLAASNLIASKNSFCNSVALGDADYCYPELKTNPVVLGTTETQTSATPGCLCLEKVNRNLALSMPLWAGHPGDGSGRLFVIEQLGRIRIYNTRTKRWNFKCFLDLTLKARTSPFPADERGALGMTFHSDFANNGRFFVFYTALRWPWEKLPSDIEDLPYPFEDKVVVSEMRVSKHNRDVADIFYEKVLVTLYQPFLNHNGGQIMFGTDGYLYLFFGDGGGAGDPIKGAQNKALLYGKILRLDVDSDPSQAYTIPPDNPFVGEAGVRPEIYAYGLRNPWRCGMDRGERGTGNNAGRIICGDVGQFRQEELDLVKPGVNYGWNGREGFECYDQALCGNMGTEELPIFAYNHTVGKSVTGGVFYRGCENPALDGEYIYGDYVSKRLFALNESDGDWVNRELQMCGDEMCQGCLQGTLDENILSFGEDEDGEIYIMTTKSSSSIVFDGSIYKIIDPSTRNDPSTCASDLTKDDRVSLPKRSFVWEADKDKPHAKIVVRISRRKKTKKRQRKSTSVQTRQPRLGRTEKKLLAKERETSKKRYRGRNPGLEPSTGDITTYRGTRRKSAKVRNKKIGRRRQDGWRKRKMGRNGSKSDLSSFRKVPSSKRKTPKRKNKGKRFKGRKRKRNRKSESSRHWSKQSRGRWKSRRRVKYDKVCEKRKYWNSFTIKPRENQECDLCRAAFVYTESQGNDVCL
ncbi:hhip-like protein 1 [Plakobranchus ocellatus]|uniref:Hhip-like protein 1 n=1 Tax=Plakobranchus ocellatus TaxID=259542 RepID=A0AAV4BAQ2_9GAST|nr:hhip-like protein 1 [Plakobranchus ocellatus]